MSAVLKRAQPVAVEPVVIEVEAEPPEVVLVFDIEADGIRPTVVHCLAIHEIGRDETLVYADAPGYPPIAEGLCRLQAADWLVAHNGRDYDIPWLEAFYPGFKIADRGCILDTLLLARRYFSEYRAHSLKEWGLRLGYAKSGFADGADWSVFTPQMAAYCVRDVAVTTLLHEVLCLAAEQPIANATD